MSDFVKLNNFLGNAAIRLFEGYLYQSLHRKWGALRCDCKVERCRVALSAFWLELPYKQSTLQPQRPVRLPGAIHTVSVCILNKAVTVTIGTMDLKYATHFQQISPIQPQQVSESRSLPGARLYFQTVLTWTMLCFVQPLGIWMHEVGRPTWSSTFKGPTKTGQHVLEWKVF